MIDILALTCFPCPNSHEVAIAVTIIGVLIGYFSAVHIRKKSYTAAYTLLLLAFSIPILLWILDGYSAFAQLLTDDSMLYSCGTCAKESISSQLSRLNYGVWILLISTPTTIVFYFVTIKAKASLRKK
jgi:ABC-type spermidine/putrescine transport system permease subunit I